MNHLPYANYPFELSNNPDFKKWLTHQPIELDRWQSVKFPENTFTGWLGETIEAVCDCFELPVEFVAMLALPAVATTVQGKFSLLIETGYFEPLNIWAISALGPSNRKSSALGFFAKPLNNWEHHQAVSIGPAIEMAKSERQTIEEMIKVERKKASKLTDPADRKEAVQQIKKLEDERPKIPTCPQMLFDDSTPEALAEKLSNNDERLSYLESEADALFGMLSGRYNGEVNLDLMLKSYLGESKKVDRKSGLPIHLKHPLLTLGVSPQPGLINDQVKKPFLINRGFFARFLLTMPESNLGKRKLKPNPIPEAIRVSYESRLLELIGYKANMKDEREVPHVVKLSREAYRIWKDFQLEIEKQLGPGGRLSDEALCSWGGKLAGNIARVAVIIQIGQQIGVRPDTVEIEQDVMKRAGALGRILVDHAIAFHDLANVRPEISKARQVLSYLKKNKANETSVRNIHQSLRQRADFKMSKDVKDAMEVLVDNGWAFAKPNVVKTGRPSEAFFIHPSISSQNTQNGVFGDIEDMFQ